MRILGVDPGTHCTGYGLVEQRGSEIRPVAFGVINAPHSATLGLRLKSIYDGLTQLIHTHKPEVIALEKAFYSKSMTAAFRIGEARAIVILCAAQAQVRLEEYAPAMIKVAVVGSGRAQKERVQYMIRILLGLAATPEPPDAADALAIAVCHCHHSQLARRLDLIAPR
jgi:crossover junction endodeoxyribonuclease RuvC